MQERGRAQPKVCLTLAAVGRSLCGSCLPHGALGCRVSLRLSSAMHVSIVLAYAMAKKRAACCNAQTHVVCAWTVKYACAKGCPWQWLAQNDSLSLSCSWPLSMRLNRLNMQKSGHGRLEAAHSMGAASAAMLQQCALRMQLHAKQPCVVLHEHLCIA